MFFSFFLLSCSMAERWHESRTPTSKDQIKNYEELQEKNRREVEQEREASQETEQEKQVRVIRADLKYEECQKARKELIFTCVNKCWESAGSNNLDCAPNCNAQIKECRR